MHRKKSCGFRLFDQRSSWDACSSGGLCRRMTTISMILSQRPRGMELGYPYLQSHVFGFIGPNRWYSEHMLLLDDVEKPRWILGSNCGHGVRVEMMQVICCHLHGRFGEFVKLVFGLARWYVCWSILIWIKQQLDGLDAPWPLVKPETPVNTSILRVRQDCGALFIRLAPSSWPILYAVNVLGLRCESVGDPTVRCAKVLLRVMSIYQ
jgi:hypothetical protein